MKRIKVKFVDFWNGFDKTNDFLKILQKKYDVELSDTPDYLFYSVFGLEHLKYVDCIRIFYTGECVVPDFNECDYAIGFDRLDFGDRYIRMPLYSMFQYRQSYESIQDRPLVSKEELHSKTDFCSFVVSNGFAQEARVRFFEKLSEYKKVNSGGRFRNNIGGAVADKLTFQMKHKFCIAFENNSYPGYTTEKIVDAFASRTIPIYYGDPTVCEDFNEAAFINVHKYSSLDDVVDVVKAIDNDDDRYLSMINAPIIRKKVSFSLLESFLYSIIEQDLEKAKRRSLSRNQQNKEAMLLRHRFFEEKLYLPYRRFLSMLKKIRSGTLLFSK